MKTRIIGAIVALMLAGVGAFVLIAYVRGADARAADGAEPTDVYIVEEAIPEGTAGDGVEDFVKIDSVPQRNVAVGAVTDLEELAGLVTDASILPGEQLLEARFIDPLELAARGDVPVPAGMQLVSFTLPADRVVGGADRSGRPHRHGRNRRSRPRRRAGSTSWNPSTQFAFNGVLVTRVQGVALRDSESDPEAVEQDPTAGIMLTIALSTHDVERWVWFTEGEAQRLREHVAHPRERRDRHQRLVPGRSEATSSHDSLPPRQSFRRIRVPSSVAARRAPRRGDRRVPDVRRSIGRRPRRGHTADRAARARAELRGDPRPRRMRSRRDIPISA